METITHDHPTPSVLSPEERLDPAIVRKLSQLNPLLSIGHIALEYVFILGAITLTHHFWHPALYILSVMWIGARQHALAILLHEGSHYRLLRNKSANDFIGEAFLAFPLFVTMRGYRLSHLAHHRHMNTEYDPDWVSKETPEWEFPKSRTQLFFMLFKIAMGKNAIWMVKTILTGGRPAPASGTKISTRSFLIGRTTYYLLLMSILTYAGWWPEFLLYWIVPLFTWLQVILRVRSIAEHFGLEYDHTFTQARTTYPSWFDRLFVASKNVWYHLDHHLYPSVPFFNLPGLHRELKQLPTFRQEAHITRSYLGVLNECSRQLGHEATYTAEPARN